jgi:pimeloyl-ACP methyl ester carboxylesterase
MAHLPKKDLFKITLENLAPPYLDYEYFKNSDQLPFRYTSNVFDMVNAWWLIEAATLVYAETEFVIEKFKQNAGLPEVKLFKGKSTQCFVASNAKFAIVAFRGSEARLRESDADPRHVIADWLADLDFLPEPWDQGGNVHRGFKNALQEVWPDLEDYISNLQKNNRKIWITGHSLGAALATLAADRYGNIQGIYTYGSPRVGDRDFKEDFNVNAYRIVNNSDIVTKVPPATMYCHVGELKYIDSEGIIHDNTNRWARWSDEIEGKFNNVFNAFGQTRKGFTEVLLDPIVDHVPTLYAIHIWNNIPLVGE